MISRELEVALHRCFVSAHRRRHRVITVDHLVLELLSEPSVASYLTSRSVDAEALRLTAAAKVAKVERAAASDTEFSSLPTAEFQRVIQRAILAMQTNGRIEVSVADMLEAALDVGA